jgi:hypothetical protein
MRRALMCAMITAPIVFLATVADAQQRTTKDQMSDDAIAARRACFDEAQARFPGPTGAANPSLSSQRETAYRTCIGRKGFRP